MKNPLHYIQEYPHKTKQILGITFQQFDDLVNQAQKYHQKKQRDLEKKKIRINKKGGGGKPKLNMEEQICLCLFYLRQMPTFEVLGLQFGLSKSIANDTFKDLSSNRIFVEHVIRLIKIFRIAQLRFPLPRSTASFQALAVEQLSLSDSL
jgi:hypothetical protein